MVEIIILIIKLVIKFLNNVATKKKENRKQD